MRSTSMTVSARALTNNARLIRSRLPESVRLMAVVKADAYGHGLAYAARAFLEGGAQALAVAIVEEAAALREAGVTAPILILGGAGEDSIDDAVRFGASTAAEDEPDTAKIALDMEKTRDGVIICKDGFKATTQTPEDYEAIGRASGFPYEVVEVDQSSLFLVIRKP